MTDISKCDGENCDRKQTCWRFTAPSNEHRQSYMAPEKRGSECEYYLECVVVPKDAKIDVSKLHSTPAKIVRVEGK